MKPRDTQRSRVYAAENEFRRVIGDKQFHEQLGYLMFVEKVERSKWFRQKYGARAFEVKDGRGRTSAGAWGSRHITLPKWARTPVVILHEIAHCVTHTEHDSVAGHGWEYVAIFLDLVRHFLGVEAHGKFRTILKQHRVRMRAKRVMSPEQKAAMVARLAPYRKGAKVAADQLPVVKAAPGALDVALAIANGC